MYKRKGTWRDVKDCQRAHEGCKGHMRDVKGHMRAAKVT